MPRHIAARVDRPGQQPAGIIPELALVPDVVRLPNDTIQVVVGVSGGKGLIRPAEIILLDRADGREIGIGVVSIRQHVATGIGDGAASVCGVILDRGGVLVVVHHLANQRGIVVTDLGNHQAIADGRLSGRIEVGLLPADDPVQRVVNPRDLAQSHVARTSRDIQQLAKSPLPHPVAPGVVIEDRDVPHRIGGADPPIVTVVSELREMRIPFQTVRAPNQIAVAVIMILTGRLVRRPRCQDFPVQAVALVVDQLDHVVGIPARHGFAESLAHQITLRVILELVDDAARGIDFPHFAHQMIQDFVLVGRGEVAVRLHDTLFIPVLDIHAGQVVVGVIEVVPLVMNARTGGDLAGDHADHLMERVHHILGGLSPRICNADDVPGCVVAVGSGQAKIRHVLHSLAQVAALRAGIVIRKLVDPPGPAAVVRPRAPDQLAPGVVLEFRHDRRDGLRAPDQIAALVILVQRGVAAAIGVPRDEVEAAAAAAKIRVIFEGLLDHRLVARRLVGAWEMTQNPQVAAAPGRRGWVQVPFVNPLDDVAVGVNLAGDEVILVVLVKGLEERRIAGADRVQWPVLRLRYGRAHLGAPGEPAEVDQAIARVVKEFRHVAETIVLDHLQHGLLVARPGRLRQVTVNHLASATTLAEHAVVSGIVWIGRRRINVHHVRPLTKGRIVRIVPPAVRDRQQVVVQVRIRKSLGVGVGRGLALGKVVPVRCSSYRGGRDAAQIAKAPARFVEAIVLVGD